MLGKIQPTYHTEEIGFISQGPTKKLVVSFVYYLDNTSHVKWYCDLRINMFHQEGEKKWLHTQRGVTIPHNVLIELNNALVKLPIDAPQLDAKETREIARFTKTKDKSICLGVVDYENGPKIDIREYVAQSSYTGFTAKGVRLDYSTRNDISKLFMLCINKMVDFEQAEIKKTLSNTQKGPPKEVVEEAF